MQKLDGYKNKLKAGRYYSYFIDALFYIAGSAIYAVSVSFFTAPNNIAPGGVTGVATVLHFLFGAPIGIMIFVLNIPLLLLALKLIGGPFILRTILCTALCSFFVDLFDMTGLPVYTNSMLLAALYGGVFAGIGLALVFMRGATTGGTDVASLLLKLKYKHISMGHMMFVIDGMVIAFATVAFKSIDSALYAVISIFASSRVIDAILYGSDLGKMVVIISEKNDDIAKAVINDMERGITILKGKGYYTGTDREVIVCAVRRPEAATLRNIVRQVDPSAFIIVCDASEIIGEGFKPITRDL